MDKIKISLRKKEFTLKDLLNVRKWKKIQEKKGIEGIKDLVKKGTYAFLESYRESL